MTQLTMNAQLSALEDLRRRPDDVDILTLTREDIPTLASLYLVAYNSPEIAENLIEAVEEMQMSFDGAFGDPMKDGFIGAWRSGKLVGAILVTTNTPWEDVDDGPFIIDLMVDPEHRGQGIATALIGKAARRAGRQGFDNIGLRVDLRQAKAAARLYDYLGFAEVD
ncbi:GNAT family N-acetyltransferase [Trueperella sp. LYQ143]|uniref:GNAT family N-acetyltransferase n=1 Tax=unclassified Trueperella TaxID=2630174 RepID=UPI003982DFF1